MPGKADPQRAPSEEVHQWRRVLDLLHEAYRRSPDEPSVERRELAAQLDLPELDIRRHVDYLSHPDTNLVKLTEMAIPPGSNRYFHFAEITKAGIDLLVDPPEEFARKHPVINQVLGDLITIGDVTGSTVAVGRDAKALVHEPSPRHSGGYHHVEVVLEKVREVAPGILPDLLNALLATEEANDQDFRRLLTAWHRND